MDGANKYVLKAGIHIAKFVCEVVKISVVYSKQNNIEKKREDMNIYTERAYLI